MFSVVAILNFNLDYEKNMVYSVGNDSILFFDHQNVGFASRIKCVCVMYWNMKYNYHPLFWFMRVYE